MSRLIRMAPALLGLALVAPTAAHAGLPPETKAAGTPWTPKKVPKTPAGTLLQPTQPAQPGQVPDREFAPTIDAGSQGIMEANHVPPPPGMTADGTCVDCQAGVLPVPAGTYVTYRASSAKGQMVASETNIPQGRPLAGPGNRGPAAMLASRDGAPAPSAVASLGGAPGYAVVGGYSASALPTAAGEPVPVGVMRTGYRPQGQVAPGGMPGIAAATTGEGAPGHAVAGGQPGQAPSTFAGPAGHKQRYPRTMLKHLFGMEEFGHLSAEREAQARVAHAMMTYGSNPATTDVPASTVFGR